MMIIRTQDDHDKSEAVFFHPQLDKIKILSNWGEVKSTKTAPSGQMNPFDILTNKNRSSDRLCFR